MSAYRLQIELRCNLCGAVFDEELAIEDEFCPTCGCDSLFERESYQPNADTREETSLLQVAKERLEDFEIAGILEGSI